MAQILWETSRLRGRRDGSGGGGGGVHAPIQQVGSAEKGLEVALPKDASWLLEGVFRVLGVRSSVSIPGADDGVSIEVTAPAGLVRNDAEKYADVNDWILRMVRGADPVDAVPGIPAAGASVRLYFTATKGFLISHTATGPAGNDWEIEFSLSSSNLNTDGVQVTTGSDDRLNIVVSTSNRPTVAEVFAAINVLSEFNAVYFGGGPSNINFPNSFTLVLPDGTTEENTRRVEDFTGGADATAHGDPSLAGGSADSTDNDLEDFLSVTWANGNGGNSVVANGNLIATPASGRSLYYNLSIDRLVFKDSAGNQFGATDNHFIDAVTWANADGSLASGTGKFATDAALLAYIIENKSYFNTLQREDGVTHLLFLHTGEQDVKVVEFTAGTLEADAIPGGALAFFSYVADRRWEVRFNRTHTIDEIAEIIRGSAYRAIGEDATAPLRNFPDGDVVVIGDDSGLLHDDAIPDGVHGVDLDARGTVDFLLAGGVDEMPAFAAIDEDAKTVTVTYNPGVEDAEAVRDLFDAIEAVAVLIAETDEDAVLEDPPFQRTFRGDSALFGQAGSVIVGGSGLPVVDPGRIYTAADYEGVVNIKGVGLARIDRELHNEHGKIATPRNLTDPDFDGFATNVTGLQAAQHGKFYYDDQSGFFAIRLLTGEDGFTGNSGFYVFDPMGENTYLTTNYELLASVAAGPWQNAPAGGAYTGALTWRGVVQRSSDIVRAAAGVGEVILVPTEHRAVYIDVFVVEAKGYVSYPPRVVVPRYFNNPTIELWGWVQTQRLESRNSGNRVFPESGTAKQYLHAKWKFGKAWFGAHEDWLTILTEAEATALVGVEERPPAGSRVGIYCQLPSGLWRFKGQGVTFGGARYPNLRLLRVTPTSAADETLHQGTGAAYGAVGDNDPGTPDLANVSDLDSPPIEISADDVWYVLYVFASRPQTDDRSNTAQHMLAERVG